MKILLIGLYAAPNLGDAVLCECTRYLLEKVFPGAEIWIRDFKGRTDITPGREPSFAQLEKSRRRVRLREWMSRYTPWDRMRLHHEAALRKADLRIQEICGEDYDLAVFAGGQIWMDFLVLYVEKYVELLSDKGVPVLFYASGTGPSWSRELNCRVSRVLQSPAVRGISSREDADALTARYLDEGKKADFAADSALWAPEVYGIRKDPQADTVGLGIMYTENISPRKTARFWVRMIRVLEGHGRKWRMFVNGSPRDVAFARYIYTLLPGRVAAFEECFAPRPERPEALVRLIAGFSCLVSFRLHSHILAAALDIPSISVYWDDKGPAFFRHLGLEKRCVTMDTPPDVIYQKLTVAEEEGYDRARIRSLGEASMEWLARAARGAVRGGNAGPVRRFPVMYTGSHSQ